MDELKQRIATRAYELWQRQGESHGHDVDHWLEAEADVTGADQVRTPKTSPRKPRSKKT